MCPITGLAVNQLVQLKLTQRHVSWNTIINRYFSWLENSVKRFLGYAGIHNY